MITAKRLLTGGIFSVLSFALAAATADDARENLRDKKIENFRNVTLEMSLKPFKKNDPAYIEGVCRELFRQWLTLTDYADQVSVMLWTSDGSEILDYTGDLAQPLEWAKYIGNPNTEHAVDSGPESLTLHQRAYHYMENPPDFSYADLKKIVEALKRVGTEMTGKPVRVGATFDPGPEFAKSEFKYKKHPEICLGATMGKKSFVCCYAKFDADSDKYAGFPNGIPQDTPFGKFFGRQSQHFLKDLGFDYLWLSNGFGFGLETWRATGAIMDREGNFAREKIGDTRRLIMEFWREFRAECPSFRIETRGTNILTSADIASDGTDLRGLYRGKLNFLPPPNSPWAALNGDFGLELAGYMSRICEIPEDEYMFRFYTHDPWWANSPWLDRYAREAHDIYLPMAVCTLGKNAKPLTPTHLAFLTVDDSYGNMPIQVPSEVIPHILQARRNAPDAPSPVVWAYPFDEYHDTAFADPSRLEEIFFGDWFVAQCINDGTPINSVITTTSLAEILSKDKGAMLGSVIFTPAPQAGSAFEKELCQFVERGGNAVIYGPITHAGELTLKLLGVKKDKALEGEFTVGNFVSPDGYEKSGSVKLVHRACFSGGGIESVKDASSDAEIIASAKSADGIERHIALVRNAGKGKAAYLRGSNYPKLGGSIFRPHDKNSEFSAGEICRAMLAQFGVSMKFSKVARNDKAPINCVSRSDNGFWFSGFVPDQTVKQLFKFPKGAPIFTGYETVLENSHATYRMPRAYFEECRVFVEQDAGKITLAECAPVEFKKARSLLLTGLDNATVRIYPSSNPMQTFPVEFRKGSLYNKMTLVPAKVITDETGTYCEAQNVSGTINIVW